MLHLCGFDDRTDSDFAAMHRTEDKILTAIGVGPVFAAPQRDGGTTGRHGAARLRPTANRRRAAAGPRSSSSKHQPGRGAEPIE
jgi:hypothetical protein